MRSVTVLASLVVTVALLSQADLAFLPDGTGGGHSGHTNDVKRPALAFLPDGSGGGGSVHNGVPPRQRPAIA